jgi:hypothetical protein
MNRSDDWVAVPYVVGLDVRDARAECNGVHLVMVGHDVDGPPIEALTSLGAWIVTDQSPVSGTLALRGDPVTVEFKRQGGGESGDREPRNPSPEGDLLRTSVDEPGPMAE